MKRLNQLTDDGIMEGSGSSISHAWLQQYGLPTYNSVDVADPDGDGMNNWHEWVAATNPTNASSALRLLSPIVTSTNVTVTWESVSGVNYFLERSTNLWTSPTFLPLAVSIPGQPNITTYSDTNVVFHATLFYRVGVSP